MIEGKVLIFAGSDGHGICSAVQSLKNLEREGVGGEIYCNYPETGIPEVFWKKTLNKVNLKNYKSILILDIPLLKEEPYMCINKLKNLYKDISLLYIDHHYEFDKENLPDFMKLVSGASECCLGPSGYLMRIGAICDRDEYVLPVSNEEMEISQGLDFSVREDINNTIDNLKKEDYQYFQNKSDEIPYPDIMSVFPNFLIADLTGGGNQWKFKSLEKAVQDKSVLYGIGVMRKIDRNELVIIKDWRKKESISVKEVLSSGGVFKLTNEYDSFYGHKNAMIFVFNDKNIELSNFAKAFRR